MKVFQEALEKRAQLHHETSVRPLPLSYYVHTSTDVESETNLSHFPITADPLRTLIDRKNFYESVLHDRDFPLLTTFLLGGVDINVKRPHDHATALHLAVLGESNYSHLHKIVSMSAMNFSSGSSNNNTGIFECDNLLGSAPQSNEKSVESVVETSDSCGRCNESTSAESESNMHKRIHKKNGYVFDYPCENGLILSFLIDNGADINAQLALSGITPLMLAAAIQNNKAIKLLVQKGADWQVKDFHGRSVLSYAARYPHVLMTLAELIGKDTLITQLVKENVLHELCKYSGKGYHQSSHRFPVLFLVEHLELDMNAPVNFSTEDNNDNKNNINDHNHSKNQSEGQEYVAYEQHLEQRLQEQEEEEEQEQEFEGLFVRRPTMIPVNERVELGTELSSSLSTTPMKANNTSTNHSVAHENKPDMFYIDASHSFKPGSTALHCAIESGDLNLVQALIQTGKANINVKDGQGQTPLQLAETLYRAHRKFIPSCLSWLNVKNWQKEMKLRRSKGKKKITVSTASSSTSKITLLFSLVQSSVRYPLLLLMTFIFNTFNGNKSNNNKNNNNQPYEDDNDVPCATIDYSAIYSYIKNYQKSSFVRDQSQRLLLLPLTEEMESEYASRICGLQTSKLRCLRELSSICTAQTLCDLVLGVTLPHVFLFGVCLIFNKFIFLLAALVLVTLCVMHVHVNSHKSTCSPYRSYADEENNNSSIASNNNNNKLYNRYKCNTRQRSFVMLGIALGFVAMQGLLLPLYSTYTYYKYYSVTSEGDKLLKYWLLPVAISTALLLSYVFFKPPYVVGSSAGQRKGLYSLFLPIASVNVAHPTNIVNQHGEVINTVKCNDDNDNNVNDKQVLQAGTLEKIYSVDFTCMVKKPLRAQYCAQLQQVVLRYDHYCGYLGSVIAGHNHRAFVYGHLALLLLLCTFYFFAFNVRVIFFNTSHVLQRNDIQRAIPQNELNALKLILPFGLNTSFYRFAYLYTQYILPMMIGIVAFQLIQQLYYILRNLTLYEVHHVNDECSVYCFTLNNTVYSLYDRGWWRNLCGFCLFMETFATRAYRPPTMSNHLKIKIAEEERIAAAQESLAKNGPSCKSRCCRSKNNNTNNNNTTNEAAKLQGTLEETALNLYKTSVHENKESDFATINDANNNNNHQTREGEIEMQDVNTNAYDTTTESTITSVPTTNKTELNVTNNNNISATSAVSDNSDEGARPMPPLAQYLFQEMIRNGTMEIATLSSEGVKASGNSVLNDNRTQQE